ncbi:hypothetical protein GCM10027403_19300 [Arthrobacter tecti]
MGTMTRTGFVLWLIGLFALVFGAIFLAVWAITGGPPDWGAVLAGIAGGAVGRSMRSRLLRQSAARGRYPCFVRLASAGPFRGKWRFGYTTPFQGQIAFQSPAKAEVTFNIDDIGIPYPAGMADTILKLQRSSEVLPVTAQGVPLEIAALPKYLRVIESSVRQPAVVV